MDPKNDLRLIRADTFEKSEYDRNSGKKDEGSSLTVG